jgi:membrane-associated protein
VSEIINFILHVDSYLLELTQNYGAWIYAILFAIVFAETGLVVTPFLPGDSLLFAAGALAATGVLDVRVATVLVIIAAIAGDAVNYSIGRSAGARIIHLANTDPRWGRWINPAYVARAHEFFERHGGKAIVLGRFMPIVRTFVPFVAGVAEMSYPAFALYNITGGVVWVGICIGAGYVFGNVPIVKENFSLVASASSSSRCCRWSSSSSATAAARAPRGRGMPQYAPVRAWEPVGVKLKFSDVLVQLVSLDSVRGARPRARSCATIPPLHDRHLAARSLERPSNPPRRSLPRQKARVDKTLGAFCKLWTHALGWELRLEPQQRSRGGRGAHGRRKAGAKPGASRSRR